MSPAKKEKFTLSLFIDKHWKHLAAAVYVTICLFDFVVMPAIISARKPSVETLEKLSHENKDLLDVVTKRYSNWEPITLANGGIFHISFGTILAGASMLKKGLNPNGSAYNIILESDSVKSYVRLITGIELEETKIKGFVDTVVKYVPIELTTSFNKSGKEEKSFSVSCSKKNNKFIYEITIKKDISSETGKYIANDLSEFIGTEFEIAASYS